MPMVPQILALLKWHTRVHFQKKKEEIYILFINLLHGNFMADMT